MGTDIKQGFLPSLTALELLLLYSINYCILQRNFHGSCILFAQVLDWRPAVIWPWSETACDFVLYLNIAVNIFYATLMGFATLLIAYKCDKKYAHKIG